MKVQIFTGCSVTLKKIVHVGPKIIEAVVDELAGQEFKVQRLEPETFTCPRCGQTFQSLSIAPVRADHTCPDPIPRPGQKVLTPKVELEPEPELELEPKPQPALLEERDLSAVPVTAGPADNRVLPIAPPYEYKDKRKKR